MQFILSMFEENNTAFTIEATIKFNIAACTIAKINLKMMLLNLVKSFVTAITMMS